MPKAPRHARTATTVPRKTVATAGLGPSRSRQLERDLRLTPEARVRAAEETARVAELRRGPSRALMLAFDRYEDFLDWQHREDARA